MTAERFGFSIPSSDAEERDQDSLLTDLAASARPRSAELRRSTLEGLAGLMEAGGELARRRRGRADVPPSATAGAPPTPPLRPSRASAENRALPPWSLAADQAVLTALGDARPGVRSAA